MTRVLALARRGGALALGRGLGLTGVIGTDGDDPVALEARLAAAGIRCPVTILDEIFEGPVRETDYHGLAQILAAAARTVGFDVLICGEGSGKLGPAIGERLSMPFLGGVVRAELRDGNLIAYRVEGSAIRAYSSPLPAVLGAVSMPLPSAPPSDAPPGARRVLALSDIGLSPAELRWRTRFAPRPSTNGAPIRRPVLFANASELAQRLIAEGLITRTARGRRPTRRGGS